MRAIAIAAITALGGVLMATQTRGGNAGDLALFDLSGLSAFVGSALPAPPNAVLVTGGRWASAYAFESSARLDTALDVAAVASHYASRITTARWRADGRAAQGGSMSVARFTGATAAGAPVLALLTVTRLTPTRLDVALRLASHESASSRGVIPSGRAAPTPGRPGGAGASVLGGTPPRRSGPAPSGATVPRAPIRLPTVEEILRAESLTSQPGEAYVTQQTLPAGFPKELLPEKSIFGIAAVSKTLVTVVVTAPDLPMASIARHLHSLQRTGWVDRSTALGGFSGESLLFRDVCRGHEIARFRIQPRDGGGVYVRVHVDTSEPCRVSGSRSFSDVALPLLLHPPGVVMPRLWGSGGLETQLSSVRMTTAQDAAAIAAHYIDHMTKSGWPLAGRIASDGFLVSRHLAKSTAGELVTAILWVTPIPNTAIAAPAVDGWMRVVRHGR